MTAPSDDLHSDRSLAHELFSSLETPLAVLSLDGAITRANDALRRAAGGAPAEGQRFVSLLRQADRARVSSTLDGLVAGASATFDARLASPANEPAFRFHATRSATRVHVVGIAQPALVEEATAQMLARVLDSAPVMLWSIDREGVYTMSEGKGLELVGFRAGESIGINALEMFQGHPAMARALTMALGGEESRIVASAAPGVYFETWCMPLRAPTGEVHGVMGLGIDATERVNAEHELREKLELIERQSATIRSLATPIIQVWDEVLCLPVIGTVDSARTADMMQGLLDAIVREQARYAIVDLTGVEIVDTSTADHLIQLFRAAKVLGVEGILCGIRPAVAQTVVALGLELGSVRTMRSLRDALKWCIRAGGQPRARASNPASNGKALAALAMGKVAP